MRQRHLLLSVVLRIIGTHEQAHEVEGLVDERLNKMFEDMRNEASRLDKMAEANGIEFKGIDYSHPKEVEAKITSPRAVRYVGLIREFDGLIAKLDTLWLSGVIADSAYSRSIYEWKRRLLRLAEHTVDRRTRDNRGAQEGRPRRCQRCPG